MYEETKSLLHKCREYNSRLFLASLGKAENYTFQFEKMEHYNKSKTALILVDIQKPFYTGNDQIKSAFPGQFYNYNRKPYS